MEMLLRPGYARMAMFGGRGVRIASRIYAPSFAVVMFGFRGFMLVSYLLPSYLRNNCVTFNTTTRKYHTEVT